MLLWIPLQLLQHFEPWFWYGVCECGLWTCGLWLCGLWLCGLCECGLCAWHACVLQFRLFAWLCVQQHAVPPCAALVVML